MLLEFFYSYHGIMFLFFPFFVIQNLLVSTIFVLVLMNKVDIVRDNSSNQTWIKWVHHRTLDCCPIRRRLRKHLTAVTVCTTSRRRPPTWQHSSLSSPHFLIMRLDCCKSESTSLVCADLAHLKCYLSF